MSTQNIRWRLAAEGGDKVVSEARKAEQAIVQGQGAVASATDKAIAASDRQIEKLKQVASQAAATTETQRRIEALAGGSTRFGLSDQASAPGNASARLSARTFEVEDRAYAQRAAELKAILDPLGAAQDRLNDELREYQALARAGKISTAELAQAQALARTRYDEAAAAIDRQGRGLTRLAVASRLNLARQGADVFVTAAMGMNPAMIAIQQGPQILDALATSGFKSTASLVALGGALTAAAAGVVLLAAAWQKGEDAANAYERAVTGVGRTQQLTAAQLRDLTLAAAEQGEVSRAAAREQAAAYLATGQIGGEVISGLIAIGKDYASVFGMDAEDATKALAKAMLDPEKAGRELTLSMGLLNQEQLTNIETLQAQGDLLGAQKVLLEALTGAVDGHADRVGTISSAWDAVTRSISDAIDRLGEFLYQTEDERIAELQERVRVGRPMGRADSPFSLDRDAAELRVLETQRSIRQMNEAGIARTAAANQQAERERLAQERREREGRAAARRAESEARRAAAEAERERREALQRTRREEDNQARLDLEVARAGNDFSRVQELEDANAVRQRERQLIDDGTAAEAARTKALAEQRRLIEARAIVQERETKRIGENVELEASRIDGLNAFVFRKEREREIEERILAYRRQGLDLITATGAALSDQAVLDQARVTAAKAAADAREREWRMTLAQARGDTGAIRDLRREDWIARRATEIENTEHWNRGDDRAQAQAAEEYGELMRAETTGAFREGLKGLVDDINSGGLRDALAEQLLNAGDRLLDKLLDGLSDIDFSGGSGSGPGSWISKGLNFLFGKNARGTNYWDGGLTLVGEEGPELADLPRGTRIRDAATSSRMLREAVQAPAAAPAALTYAPSYTNYGVDTQRLEAIMENDRRQFASKAVAAIRDADQRRLGR